MNNRRDSMRETPPQQALAGTPGWCIENDRLLPFRSLAFCADLAVPSRCYNNHKVLRQSLPASAEGRPGAQRFRRWSGEPTAQHPRGRPGVASSPHLAQQAHNFSTSLELGIIKDDGEGLAWHRPFLTSEAHPRCGRWPGLIHPAGCLPLTSDARNFLFAEGRPGFATLRTPGVLRRSNQYPGGW